MKKKFVLVNYAFTTGDHEYQNAKLVSIRFEGGIPDLNAVILAEKRVESWFRNTHPESTLNHVIGGETLEATYLLRDELTKKPDDGYSSDMSIDRIEQLLEETKPYTDRLVLNGWAPMETIEHFQARGHYVNTFEDPDNKDQYTVIKW